MTPQKGHSAPDFTLYSTEKTPVTLSSLKGKNVLLLFFPQAFTGTCTSEVCMMRDGLQEYQSMNAEVFGISVDSVFTLIRFRDEHQLNFLLLSDFNKEVSRMYNSMYENFGPGGHMKGVSKRSAFVIDREGIIQYAEVLENASELPDFAAIKSCLSSLR